MSTTTTAPAVKTGTGLGVTALVFALIGFAIAWLDTSMLAVIIATIGLLLGILTIRKDSVKALPITAIVVAIITILGVRAMMGA